MRTPRLAPALEGGEPSDPVTGVAGCGACCFTTVAREKAQVRGQVSEGQACAWVQWEEREERRNSLLSPVKQGHLGLNARREGRRVTQRGSLSIYVNTSSQTPTAM